MIQRKKKNYEIVLLPMHGAPPPLMAQISGHFLPHFFSFAIESYIYETDFTLGRSQKYHF